MKRIPLFLVLLLLLTGCVPTGAETPTASQTPSPSPAVPSEHAQPKESEMPTPMASETPAPDTSASETPAPETPAPEEKEITLFLPNETVDGFVEETVRVAVEPQCVVDALIARGALPEGLKVLEFRVEQEGKHIVIDLSQEFETALCSMGTSGEAMLTGSLVNTLLGCWGADTLSFTCEGRVVESGHVVYDFPLSAGR